MSFPMPVALVSGEPESVALEPAVSGEPESVALELAVSGEAEPLALELAEPKTLRIGPHKHAYVYTQIARNKYRCSRGSDQAKPGEVLWLRRVGGEWLASDADSETPSEYVVRFSSKEDILSPGWHSWRIREADDRVGQFETTVL